MRTFPHVPIFQKAYNTEWEWVRMSFEKLKMHARVCVCVCVCMHTFMYVVAGMSVKVWVFKLEL